MQHSDDFPHWSGGRGRFDRMNRIDRMPTRCPRSGIYPVDPVHPVKSSDPGGRQRSRTSGVLRALYVPKTLVRGFNAFCDFEGWPALEDAVGGRSIVPWRRRGQPGEGRHEAGSSPIFGFPPAQSPEPCVRFVGHELVSARTGHFQERSGLERFEGRHAELCPSPLNGFPLRLRGESLSTFMMHTPRP